MNKTTTIELPNGEKVPSFTARFIHHSRLNLYWEKSFDETGGGEIPDCFSTDGIKPDPSSEKKQSDLCAGCPQNQFGTAEKGEGKACQNRKRLHVFPSDMQSLIPFRLGVSSVNMKQVDQFVTMIECTGKHFQLVETEFSLIKSKSNSGQTFAKLVMKEVPDSFVEERGKQIEIKNLRDKWLPVMKDQAFGAEEGQ